MSSPRKRGSGPRLKISRTTLGPAPTLPTRASASAPIPTLPAGYGAEIVVLQVRDPHWLHAYWELQPGTLERGRAALGAEAGAVWLVLRVCQVTEPVLQVSRFFDIGLPGGASAWTFEVAPAGHSWMVQIGWMTPSGKFHLLLQSNVVRTPPDSLSDQIDETWGWLPLPSVAPGAGSSSR